MIGSLSIWHWVIILAALALLFGRGKLSALLRDVGRGIAGFRHGIREGAEALAESETDVRTSVEGAGRMRPEGDEAALLDVSAQAQTAPLAQQSIERGWTDIQTEAAVLTDSGHEPPRREGESK